MLSEISSYGQGMEKRSETDSRPNIRVFAGNKVFYEWGSAGYDCHFAQGVPYAHLQESLEGQAVMRRVQCFMLAKSC